MLSLSRTLHEFLKRSDGLDIRLGQEAGPRITTDNREWLFDQLEQLKRQNFYFTLGVSVLYVVWLLLALVLVGIKVWSGTIPLSLIGSSTVLAILGLRRLWGEKNHLGLIVAVLPNLSPREQLVMLQTIYFRTQAPRNHEEDS